MSFDDVLVVFAMAVVALNGLAPLAFYQLEWAWLHNVVTKYADWAMYGLPIVALVLLGSSLVVKHRHG